MKPILLAPQEQIAAEQFRTFYACLTALRDAILAAPASVPVQPPALVAVVAEPALPVIPVVPVVPIVEPVREPSVADVRAKLRKAILDHGYQPEDDFDAPIDPGYVMAAVADEVLLTQCPHWSGYATWTDQPLEAELYGSALAGDRVIDTAQELLARRRDDPRTATTILLALLAGFRGRYYDRDDRGLIAKLEEGLYQLVARRPYLEDDAAPYAAPNLTATTLIGQSMRPLPALWPWIAGIVLVIALYLPVSHFVWWLEVRKIDQAADRVVALHDDAERRADESLQ